MTLLLIVGPGGASLFPSPSASADAGSMARMILDMDPEDGAPNGNGTFAAVNNNSSFGAIQDCARINENDTLDADEDVTADSLTFDVVLDSVPTDFAMLGGQASILYDDNTTNGLQVWRVNSTSSSLAEVPGSMMITRNGGAPLGANQTVPDTDNSGHYLTGWAQLDTNAIVDGSGAASRLAIRTRPFQTGQGTTPAGIYPLTLDQADSFHNDVANISHTPNAFVDAKIAVNTNCPLPPADIEMLSLTLTSVSGPTVPAGTDFTLRVEGTARNNGPNPADIQIDLDLAVPPDCTRAPNSGQSEPFLNVPPGEVRVSTRDWTVNCSGPSDHQFSASGSVIVTGLADESNPANNGPINTSTAVAVEASSDPKVTSVSVIAPAEAATGAPFTVSVSASLHNNGPLDPVNADTTLDLAVPVDCTRAPNNSQLADNSSLSTSTPVTVSASWTVTCSTSGLKTFTGTGTLVIDQLHVTDSNPNNNTGQGQATTDTSLGVADVKVTSVTVTSPATAPINTNFPVTVNTTVHNNGPFFPINTDTTLTLNLPPDCFTPIKTLIMQDASLGPSIAALLPQVTFYVTCIDHSSHDFTATASIVIDDPLAGDPNPANNTVTSPASATAVIRTSDLKVVGATIGGPSQGVTNTPFNVNVDATVHNNGPDPAPAIVSVSLTLPPDCTTPVNPLTLNVSLPVSSAVPIPTQTFPVTCTIRSDHGFPASVSIAGPLHVDDPNSGNNSAAAGPIVVSVFDLADLKVSSVITSGPAQAVVNTPFNVSATVNIHDNGPYGPANADVTATLNLPGDCATADPNPAFADNVAAPVSVSTAVTFTWSVTCTANSFHSFSTDASVVTDEFHVSDPSPGNNSGTSAPVAVPVFVQADGKITSAIALNPPLFIPANTNVSITVRKVLHNNGPFGPATFTLSKSSTPPPGCTVTPPPASNHTLSVSTAVTVDEVWTVNCAPGSYQVFLDNTLSVTGQHVADPTASNNSNRVVLTLLVDTDGDGVPNDVEVACGSNPNSGTSVPERIDGAFAGVDDDGDTQVDEALPPGAAAYDCDGDGYTGAAENHVYAPSTQGDQDPCGTNSSPPTDPPSPIGWPADLAGGDNRVNISDVLSFLAPTHYLFTTVGTVPGDRRWNLDQSGNPSLINISDMLNVVVLAPRMLGVQRAFGGPECPWPP